MATAQRQLTWAAGLREFEDWLAVAPLEFDNIKDYRAETLSIGPMFQTTYWNAVELPWRLPLPQGVFVDQWLQAALNRQSLDPELVPALRARAQRAYPSLVREHHLRMLIEASGEFETTCRDGGLDVQGIDVLAVRLGVAVGLRSYHHSYRSAKLREHKDKKYEHLHLPLIVDLTPNQQIGQYHLHDGNQVEWICDLVDLLLEKSEPNSVYHASRILSWVEAV